MQWSNSQPSQMVEKYTDSKQDMWKEYARTLELGTKGNDPGKIYPVH